MADGRALSASDARFSDDFPLRLFSDVLMPIADSPSLAAFPRPSYAPLRTYQPQRPRVTWDLSANTNQWGAPPAAVRAIREFDASLLVSYPPIPTTALQEALAEYIGTGDATTILPGAGSDDLLDAAMRALAMPGDVVATPSPSFVMIPYFARTNGLEPVTVDYTPSWDVDVDALLARAPRIVYLCAPNNPTGTSLPAATIERVLAEAPGFVILDEAYAEFAETSWAARAPGHGRLLVARTLSKAFGLAGLRLGYLVGQPDVLTEVEKARGPFKVNALADLAARTALTEDLPWIRQCAADAVAAREPLRALLEAAGLAPLPSAANFLCVPMPGAAAAAAVLQQAGVLVRAFPALPGVGDALRITVGPPAAMDALRAALPAAIDAAAAAATTAAR